MGLNSSIIPYPKFSVSVASVADGVVAQPLELVNSRNGLVNQKQRKL
jgi:hypothetical protein